MPQYRRCSDCSHCALDGKRIVYGQMPEVATNGIVLLGEAPGAAEEAEGTPFTGPSGRLLNWALKCSGIDRHKCWVTNSILCRPPTNDIGGFEGESAKKACKVGLDAELRAAKQAGARVILALGETALRALGVAGTPSSLRGSVLDGVGAASGLFVIPTYHPAYLYRNNWTRVAGGSASHTAVWLSDLEKAREVARPGWKRPAERFITHPTIQDLEALWTRVQREPDLVLGVDIETTSLDPRYGEIVVIGFSTSEEDAICVPLLKAGPVGSDGRRHGIPYWSNGSATRARYYLEKILTTAKQMYQYGFFDIPYLRYHGFPVPYELYVYDSFILHTIVSPETEHDLEFITSVYGKTPSWKNEFKNRAGGIFDMDETRMRAYNCRDVVVLPQIVYPMLEHMHELGLDVEFTEEVRPMLKSLMIMREKGVLFDSSRLESFNTKVEKVVKRVEKDLRALGKLPEEFSLTSTDDLGYFLFGAPLKKKVQLTSWVFEVEVPAEPTKKEPDRTSKVVEKIVWGEEVEKAALRELPREAKVLKSTRVASLDIKRKGTDSYNDLVKVETLANETSPIYLVPGHQGPRTKTGYSTDKDGILSLRVAAQNRLEYLEALKTPREDEISKVVDLLEWLSLFSEYKEYYKLYTAFTKYRPDSNHRIHPSWGFVSTGRLSCSSPNLQQLCKYKGDKDSKDEHDLLVQEVRRFFISPPGWSMVSADFASAEVGLLSFEIEDSQMIADYEAGISPHASNVKILFGFEKGHPLFDEAKSGAKKFQFGGLSYGGGDRFVHRQIIKDCPHINISFAAYKEAKARWMERHLTYEPWRTALEAEVLEKRIIYNEFGRARIFLDNDKDIVKEAMNFKIQSAGASILNRVIARIQARIDAHRPTLKGYPIMQIHDQLVYECPDEEIDIFKTFITEEMTRPFIYKGHPRSLRIELSTGKTFGDLD